MLKYENIQAKLGRACDLETLETLSLPNKQLTEVHDLSKLKALKEIDLSNNRITFQRQLAGLFKAEKLEVVNLTGNPVVNSKLYRIFMVINLPNLKILDGVPITEDERKQAEAIVNGEQPVAKTTKPTTATTSTEPSEATTTNNKDTTAPDNTKEQNNATPQTDNSATANADARVESNVSSASVSSQVTTAPQPAPSDASDANSVEKLVETTQKTQKTESVKETQVDHPKTDSPPKTPASSAPDLAAAETRTTVDSKAVNVAQVTTSTTQTPASPTPDGAKKTAKSSGAAKPKNPVQSPAKNATPKQDTQPPKQPNNPNPERETIYFRDNRTGLTISTALSDGTAVLQPPKPSPKKKTVKPVQKRTEESIFGTKATIDDDIDDLIGDVDADINALSIEDTELSNFNIPTTSTKKTVSAPIFEEDDTSVTSSKISTSNFDDDDLFSLVSKKPDANKAKSSLVDFGTSFNVDEYIAKGAVSTSSLFD